MNLPQLAIAMATVGTICFAYCAHGLWKIRRDERDRLRPAARIAEINARLARVPAAPDNQPGRNLADHDECERIWNAPFNPQTGLELLRREINKQKKEDT